MNNFHSTALKAVALAFVLGGALAGCSTPSSTSSGSTMGASGSTETMSASGATPKQVNMCNVIRGYARQSNATGGELRAQCDRQLGTELCTKCLESGL